MHIQLIGTDQNCSRQSPFPRKTLKNLDFKTIQRDIRRMETFDFSLYSARVHLGLFKDVDNSKTIKDRLVNASINNDHSEQVRLDWAFIDASMITSRQHLFTAIFQALVSRSHNELKTKTIHSEILWTLSPGSNITEAIKKFGIGEKTTEVLLMKIQSIDNNVSKDELEESARNIIDGSLVELDGIGEASIVNWKELRRLYKLNDDPLVKQLEAEKMKSQQLDHLDNQLHQIIDRLVSASVAVKSVAA